MVDKIISDSEVERKHELKLRHSIAFGDFKPDPRIKRVTAKIKKQLPTYFLQWRVVDGAAQCILINTIGGNPINNDRKTEKSNRIS